MLRLHSHVAPGGNAALIDAVGQVDQLAVVLQAVFADGFVHTLAAQWHRQALSDGQQTHDADTQQLDTEQHRLYWCGGISLVCMSSHKSAVSYYNLNVLT